MAPFRRVGRPVRARYPTIDSVARCFRWGRAVAESAFLHDRRCVTSHMTMMVNPTAGCLVIRSGTKLCQDHASMLQYGQLKDVEPNKVPSRWSVIHINQCCCGTLLHLLVAFPWTVLHEPDLLPAEPPWSLYRNIVFRYHMSSVAR